MNKFPGMAGMPELSEYEKRRLRNIEDNKRVLALINKDLENYGITLSGKALYDETQKPQAPPVKKPAVKRRDRTTNNALLLAQYSPPRTRSRKSGSTCSSTATSRSSSPDGGKQRLVVKFGFGMKRPDGANDGDDDFEEMPNRRRSYAMVVDQRPADEITDDDLACVAGCFGDKVYDTFDGSSCHQCRQKTRDQKTICRSGECVGVRGQFCGPCLKIRYGEDAKAALKNPEWACPPCRGICNCSFCRKKAGRSCTGILIHLARQRGFDDVNSYLQSLQKLTQAS